MEVIGGGGFILKSFSKTKLAFTPGFIMFAIIKAKEIAIKVVNKYKKIDLPPILPNELVSSRFVTPVTIEKKTTGTISIFKAEINKTPITFIGSSKNWLASGIKLLNKLPISMPKTKDKKILLVSVMLLI